MSMFLQLLVDLYCVLNSMLWASGLGINGALSLTPREQSSVKETGEHGLLHSRITVDWLP